MFNFPKPKDQKLISSYRRRPMYTSLASLSTKDYFLKDMFSFFKKRIKFWVPLKLYSRRKKCSGPGPMPNLLFLPPTSTLAAKPDKTNWETNRALLYKFDISHMHVFFDFLPGQHWPDHSRDLRRQLWIPQWVFKKWEMIYACMHCTIQSIYKKSIKTLIETFFLQTNVRRHLICVEYFFLPKKEDIPLILPIVFVFCCCVKFIKAIL